MASSSIGVSKKMKRVPLKNLKRICLDVQRHWISSKFLQIDSGPWDLKSSTRNHILVSAKFLHFHSHSAQLTITLNGEPLFIPSIRPSSIYNPGCMYPLRLLPVQSRISGHTVPRKSIMMGTGSSTRHVAYCVATCMRLVYTLNQTHSTRLWQHMKQSASCSLLPPAKTCCWTDATIPTPTCKEFCTSQY